MFYIKTDNKKTELIINNRLGLANCKTKESAFAKVIEVLQEYNITEYVIYLYQDSTQLYVIDNENDTPRLVNENDI